MWIHSTAASRKLLSSLCGFSLVLLAAGNVVAQVMPSSSIVVKKPEYELYYLPEHREDGERAVRLLDQTVAVAKAKYGTIYRGAPCKINLYPETNRYATTYSAYIQTDMSGSAGSLTVAKCTVHILAWSATEWKSVFANSTLGDPKDIEYWNALLVNEYITAFHFLATDGKPTGFSYLSAPSWWIEGIEAYDGYYHSTEASLVRVRGLMGDGRLAAQNVVCCEALNGQLALQVANEYQDGLPLVAFLAQRFGEDVHRRIMRSEKATFFEAVTAETGLSIPDMFVAYRDWVNSWDGHSNSVRLCTSVSDCQSAVSENLSIGAGAGSKQILFKSLHEWTIGSDVPWISSDITSGNAGTKGLDIRFTANSDRAARTGTVKIMGQTASRNLIITQAGNDGTSPPGTGIGPGITITSPGGFNSEIGNINVSVGSASGQFQLSFTADNSWTVGVDVPWVRYEGTSGGRGLYGRSLFYESNPERTSRVGVVTIKTAMSTVTLTITQAGRQ